MGDPGGSSLWRPCRRAVTLSAPLILRRLESAMKVQASIVLSFQAKTLTEAGAVLDVLARAHEREDVGVGAVELTSPPRDRLVTLPPVPASGHAGPGVPVTG